MVTCLVGASFHKVDRLSDGTFRWSARYVVYIEILLGKVDHVELMFAEVELDVTVVAVARRESVLHEDTLQVVTTFNRLLHPARTSAHVTSGASAAAG